MSEESGEYGAAAKFYDNLWVLLGLGIVVPTLIFTVWGLYEVFNVPYLPIVK